MEGQILALLFPTSTCSPFIAGFSTASTAFRISFAENSTLAHSWEWGGAYHQGFSRQEIVGEVWHFGRSSVIGGWVRGDVNMGNKLHGEIWKVARKYSRRLIIKFKMMVSSEEKERAMQKFMSHAVVETPTVAARALLYIHSQARG